MRTLIKIKIHFKPAMVEILSLIRMKLNRGHMIVQFMVKLLCKKAAYVNSIVRYIIIRGNSPYLSLPGNT